MKKNAVVAGLILFAIFIPVAYAQSYDSQSLDSRYNQYSPSGINNPYTQYGVQYSPSSVNNPYSQYEVQYSPSSVNNPYSQYEVQYSPKNMSTLSAKEDHNWHTGYASGANTQAKKRAKKAKESPEEVMLSNLLNKSKPKKSIPVFFYLLVLSSLAVVATVFIVIGIFKK